MRRLLLMTAAAGLVLLVACSGARTGAAEPDTEETRVYLLSGAELAAASLRGEDANKDAEACGENAKRDQVPACDAGSEG